MLTSYTFYTDTALSLGLQQLLRRLEDRLELEVPVDVYLAGGMAIHLYTASRATTDVDAEFGRRLFLPSDLLVNVTLEDGSNRVVYFDTNYNSTFALMHEDYVADSVFVDLGLKQLRLRVLSPVDLAVSKISRFADVDKEDIATLVRLGLTNSREIEKRSNEALGGYVGNVSMLKLNIRDALAIASMVEAEYGLRDSAPATPLGARALGQLYAEDSRVAVRRASDDATSEPRPTDQPPTKPRP